MGDNMLIKKINELRKNLERALSAKEMDNNEILRLSMELDKYIVEYMKIRVCGSETDKDARTSD
jgi:uncharacterized protein YnzC (UPF0291/DUF896 family)